VTPRTAQAPGLVFSSAGDSWGEIIPEIDSVGQSARGLARLSDNESGLPAYVRRAGKLIFPNCRSGFDWGKE
jgi:hypothetical protein